MKKYLYLLMFVPCVLCAQNPKLDSPEQYRLFKHMEVGTTFGSTGIGVEISTPINEHLNLRAGFSMMPTIKNTKSYAMTTVNAFKKELTQEEQERRIKNLCENYLSSMMNAPIDEYVGLTRQLGYYNGKLLIDWYPFHKKNWYFTAGVYVGSKLVAKAYNAQEESATMLAINMYNDMYDKIMNLDEYEYPSFSFGKYSYELPPEDGETVKKYMQAAFNEYGKIAVRVGDDLEGNPNYLEPNEDGIMKADAKVNMVKPYIGFGFNKNFGYDKRWNIGFNAGAMYWGVPSIIYYKKNGETLDLVHDVKNIKGWMGNYIKFAKALPVLPVLEVKLAYTIY